MARTAQGAAKKKTTPVMKIAIPWKNPDVPSDRYPGENTFRTRPNTGGRDSPAFHNEWVRQAKASHHKLNAA
jgi:hypothetical protein